MKIYTLLLTVLLMVGCSDDFFDVNTDPNQITDPSTDLTLVSGQVDIGYFMQDTYNTAASFWVQYYTRAGNIAGFDNRDQYDIQPGDNGLQRDYTGIYSGPLFDLQITSVKAKAAGDDQTWAVAELLKAYAFQMIVDMWDKAPYTQALQGLEFRTPKYDDGDVIYADLITKIDSALAVIDPLDKIDQDIIFQGDMELWKKFANTLKLRIYMRQTEVNGGAAASSGVATIASEDFLGLGEDAEVLFDQANPANRHPADEADLDVQTFIAASATIVDFMKSNSDPRLDVYFRAPIFAATDNPGRVQRGVIQGKGTDLVGDEAGLDFWSARGNFLIGAGSAAVYFSASESLFLQAEAALRGYTSESAADLYVAGVEASFIKAGLSVAQATVYLKAVPFPTTGTFEDQLEAIMTQKWVALCGRQGLEMWAEWRRTGLPGTDLIQPSPISILPDPNAFPLRFPYIQREIDLNSETPPAVAISTAVWWDVN